MLSTLSDWLPSRHAHAADTLAVQEGMINLATQGGSSSCLQADLQCQATSVLMGPACAGKCRYTGCRVGPRFNYPNVPRKGRSSSCLAACPPGSADLLLCVAVGCTATRTSCQAWRTWWTGGEPAMWCCVRSISAHMLTDLRMWAPGVRSKGAASTPRSITPSRRAASFARPTASRAWGAQLHQSPLSPVFVGYVEH